MLGHYPGLRAKVSLSSPAESLPSQTSPKSWSQIYALSNLGLSVLATKHLVHPSRPVLPVLQAKQMERFLIILLPCFILELFAPRVYKHSQILLDIAV